ncbi:MAG: hydrogenase nickel incorporation protein HypB [Erysipelotrichaceae bacterium]|nr:hydrogenase nickel incorporation protein HypB [Erysipelotrichaceae bacterium]
MEYQVVKVKEDILVENNEKAKEVRKMLKEKGIFFLNVMASPGSGKTTLLTNIINKLKKKYKIGVMEADIDGEVDAERISSATGVKSIQIHTSGACHLTAQMVNDAINEFNVEGLDILILENIGNLVCPAEFDTGSNINMMLLSVPEGDDKPLKYPLMFQVSDIAVITKIDTLPVFNFDFKKCEANIHKRNPNAKVFKVSSIKDEGTDELADYLDSLFSYR